ncbi:MAG: hypothetical protein ACLP51_02380 [Syntrophobacteraceae bacterium]
MQHESEYSWVRDLPWVIFFGILSSAYCLLAARHTGAAFDEPIYLLQGLESWHLGGDGALTKIGIMPLPVDVTTLPLYVWELLRGQRFDQLSEFGRMLPVARAATLVFWWAVLFYGWRVGWGLAGRWGGRLAVALLACEPSLLAHASLATTDVAITACMLALVYHFREGRTSGWWLRVGLPSLLFGLALLAKASALVLGPLCLIVVELDRLGREQASAVPANGGVVQFFRRLIAQLGPFRRDIKQIFGLGFLLMLVYCGSDWRPEPSFVAWARTLPHGPMASVMVYVADHLRIFSNGAEAIVYQIKHNNVGQGVFIAGRTDPRALWYYFPAAMTMKLTASLLALPLLVAVVRPKALWNWVTLITAVLILFSVTFRVQLGIRLVLPLIGFFIVGAAGAAANMIAAMQSGWRRHLAAGAVAGCVFWTAAASLIVWPNAICYVNELWGGTTEGYKLLSDSNYDWGQGIGDLRDWQQRNGVENLDVWYFGTDPDRFKGPFHLVSMTDGGFQGPDDFIGRFRGRYLAVGTTYLYGGYIIENPKKGHPLEKSALIAIRYLRTIQPVDRTTTFLIYDFTGEHQVESGSSPGLPEKRDSGPTLP